MQLLPTTASCGRSCSINGDGGDYGWIHQIASYRLAWWAFETIELTVEALGRRGTYRNFSLFRQYVPTPGDLPPWADAALQ